MELTLYLTARKLLEVKSLFHIQHLDVKQLPDYNTLSPEEKARLEELLRTKLDR
jgi:hypothetical protein